MANGLVFSLVVGNASSVKSFLKIRKSAGKPARSRSLYEKFQPLSRIWLMACLHINDILLPKKNTLYFDEAGPPAI